MPDPTRAEEPTVADALPVSDDVTAADHADASDDETVGGRTDGATGADVAEDHSSHPARWSLVGRAQHIALKSAQKAEEWLAPGYSTEPWR